MAPSEKFARKEDNTEIQDKDWDTESSSSDQDDYVEELQENSGIDNLGICPFCGESQEPELLLTKHFLLKHNLDFVTVLALRTAEDQRQGKIVEPQLAFARWLNFTRQEKFDVTDSLALFTDDKKWFELQLNDECLVPKVSDGLLFIDVEEILEKYNFANSSTSNDIKDNISSSQLDHFNVQRLHEEIQRMHEDIDHMRRSMQHILGTSIQETISTTMDIDSAYFASYSHYGIHLEMLRDEVRTGAYHNFIRDNAAMLVVGRRWLDVGCGTGVLSAFAGREGALQVVGVDCADVIWAAQDMIRDNGLSGNVELLHGKLEELNLMKEGAAPPCFDVVISEWMGYALLFESMLDSVLYARDHLLAPGGRVFPEVCRLFICGAADSTPAKHVLHFWDNVHGLRMKAMRNQALREALVTVVPGSNVATDSFQLLVLDMTTANTSELEFCQAVRLCAQRDCVLDSLVLYFDVEFLRSSTVVEGFTQVSFSTGPMAPTTHWKQTVLLLEEPVSLSKGEYFESQVSIRRSRVDARALQIRLRHGIRKQIFCMD